MARGATKSRTRAGWGHRPELGLPDAFPIGQRRWRILQGTRPTAADDATPPWVHTPEQYVEWLSLSLTLGELVGYFREIEAIARRSSDLELLRFAHLYLAQLRGNLPRRGMPPR